jgi:phosphatidate cytidylyltransferase
MLGQRIISALVLIPLALAGVFLGSPYLDGLVALFALAMAWEWVRVCHRGRFVASGLVVVLAAVGGVVAYRLVSPPAALLILVAGAVAAALLAETGVRLWHGLGAVYVGLPCLAMLWIRGDAQPGLDTLLWTLLLVWSVDTGAYLAGRTIGGPRLAPSISPKKTWAGFAGGLLAATLVGLLGAYWLGLQSWWPLAAIAAVLAVVEQCGDLAESAFKRRFGVKDSSNLIPGHGGVLDRVDGLLTVVVAVAGLMIVTKGGVGTWQ